MNCIYTKQQKTDNLKGEILGEFSSSETTYPGGNSVKNITEDVSYNQNNNFITSLLWGAKWTNLPDNKLTYCINFGSSVVTSVGGVDMIEPTSATVESVDQCMTDLGEIINLTIEKTTNVNDAILSFNFIDADSVSFLGLANPPVPTNDPYYSIEGNYTSLLSSVWAAGNIYIAYKTSFNYQKGSYNYITIVHELGHAIGLAHPHDEGGNSTIFDGVTSAFGDFGTYNANLQPLTIMTYNDTQSPYVPNTQSSSGFLSTFGPIDIVALQYMYGKNPNFNIGNTTYTFPNSTTNKFWETIYDAGGINTIDASSSTTNTVINLNDSTIQNNTNLAGVSLSSNAFGGLTIAKGVSIQNVITGTADDTIVGNELDNTITITNGGNDTIDGADGYDTVIINNNRSNVSITVNDQENTITLSDNSNTITLKNCEKIIFNDQEVIVSSLTPEPTPEPTPNVPYEVGTILLNNNWKTVSLQNTYTNPIVITSDATLNSADAVVVRIRNVTSTSFQCRLQETSNLNGVHPNETISYLVGEKGSWSIGNSTIQFGSVTTNQMIKRGNVSVVFPNVYSSIPSILTQVQTYNDASFVSTRIRQITNSYFTTGLEEQESTNGGSHGVETIGWMSINQGDSLDGSTVLESRLISNVTHQNKIISYQNTFSSPPLLFTKLVSYVGQDSATTRIVQNTNTQAIVRVVEDRSKDREINHTIETVCYLAIL